MTREYALGVLVGMRAMCKTREQTTHAEALDMAISALREQPRWISVEEALPERKGKYLVFAVGSYFGYAIEIAYWTPKYDGFNPDLKGRAIWYDHDSEYGDFELDGVAYWVPMPGVPKKEEV